MTGFVYFIGPEEWGIARVKIGYSESGPLNRLSSFQTGSPFPLKLYAYTPGDRGLERALHESFAPLRLHGEWFAMDGKLLALVSAMHHEHFGARATSEREFGECVSEFVCNDETPHPKLYELDEWLASADSVPVSEWLHDKAWAAYQAERAG